MPEKDRRFITEKIQKPPLTSKQKIKNSLIFALRAVLFGVIAAGSFVIAKPLMENAMQPESQAEEPGVSIPLDEAAETTEPEQTHEEAETENIAEETEPVEVIVQNAVERHQYTISDLNSMISSLRSQMQTADQSIVTVHSVQQDVDWFNNPVETAGLYAGAVVAETETELLIMTPLAATGQADTVKVTFLNETEVDGQMKQQDTISGIAIVSVDKSLLDEPTKASAVPITLGNSYLVREGDLIIAVGNPAGKIHSADYGFVSYIQKNMHMVDRTARMLYSGIHADAAAGTFVLNADGELIGWATVPDEEEAVNPSITKIVGISDYKGILENLSNGLAAPCLGIQGQVVTNEMHEKGMPLGIYVFHAVEGRPAYDAGLQSGDIITGINGHECISVNEFRNIMDGLKCGQLVRMTVARNGRDEYTELEFQVTVGAR